MPILDRKNITSLISFSSSLAMVGVYLIIWGSLNQFSTVVRNGMNIKGDRTFFGTILIIGSIVFTGTTLQSVIYRLYSPNNSGMFDLINLVFAVSSLLTLSIGALLIRSSDLKSLQPTKV
jgi:hypothetical protein